MTILVVAALVTIAAVIAFAFGRYGVAEENRRLWRMIEEMGRE